MKKYFFPILMALVIGSGLLLTITPYMAEYWFPLKETAYQKPKVQDVRRALSDWFGVGMDQIQEAEAMRQRTATETTDWYRFGLPRSAVQRFIVNGQLRQLDLTPEVMQTIFVNNAPVVPWWDPAALQRQTYFLGSNGSSEIALIYNDEVQRGYMRIRGQAKSSAMQEELKRF